MRAAHVVHHNKTINADAESKTAPTPALIVFVSSRY
jgi:hypothetical protein